MKKITFLKDELLNALTLPCNAATGSKDREIYNHVRIESKQIQNQLTVKCTGNNGKCETISYSKGRGDEVCFVVEGRRIKSLVSTYNKTDDITLTINEMDLKIQQNKSIQNLKLVDPNSFPCFNDSLKDENTSVIVDTDAFLFALERVGFATGNAPKAILNTVNICAKQGELMFTATDTHIMSQFTIPATVNGILGKDFSITSAVVAQFAAIKGKAKETKLSYDSKTSRLNIGNHIINASIANEQYPLSSICKVLATQDNSKNCITVPTEALKQAISRIGITSDRASDKSVLKIESDKDSLLISESNNPIESLETISITQTNPDSPLLVGFSIKNLALILSQIKGDNLNIRLDEKNTAMVEDCDYAEQPILMMPCRI
jgi:DNA polymerase III sliding clamp (beta) subunit (PCNA family)